MSIESEAAALDIVNSRFPRADVELWDVNRSYSDGAYNGWISAPFYAGSAGAFAGYIEWQFRRIE